MTIRDLINKLSKAGDKLGYDMPVIIEHNIDCRDADGDLFTAWDVLNNDIPDIMLRTTEAQSAMDEGNEMAYFDYYGKESVLNKKTVLCITWPAFKYGDEEDNF